MEPAEPGIWVFHPGEFLADELVSRKETPKDLVFKGISEERLMLVLQGKAKFSAKLAQHVGRRWNMDPDFWLRLQLQWDTYPKIRNKPPWPREFRKKR